MFVSLYFSYLARCPLREMTLICQLSICLRRNTTVCLLSFKVRDKSDYEVASGVCTPSKQPDSNSVTPQRPSSSPGPQIPVITSPYPSMT